MVMLNNEFKASDDYLNYLAKSMGTKHVKCKGNELLNKKRVTVAVEKIKTVWVPNKKQMSQARKASKDDFILQQRTKGPSEGSGITPEVLDGPSGSSSSSSSKSEYTEDSLPKSQVEKPRVPYPSSSLTLSFVEYGNQFINDNPDVSLIDVLKDQAKIKIKSMVEVLTAHDIWIAIERLQQGESLNIQDVKTNLFWEFDKFTSHDGESMESYYSRFYKMINEMIRNNLTVAAMQKNLELISKYFKKFYKPTNNNFRTSSNSINKNVNTSPWYKNDNQTWQFGKQMTVTVAGVRKPKRVKDYTYHKEKMLLCKHAEKGVPLQEEFVPDREETLTLEKEGVIHRTNVSIPSLKSTQIKDKVVPNNSQMKFKKTEVEEHLKISNNSNKTKSVTACNDRLKSRTSNVNVVCATCGKLGMIIPSSGNTLKHFIPNNPPVNLILHP
nr:hypothetical protein [Tanacetum cinerariifolium]